MPGSWRAQTHRRLGEAIWLGAQADFVQGRLMRPTRGLVLANLVAIVVLLMPAGIIASGALVAWAFWAAFLGVLLGASMMVLGLYLWPRRAKMPEGLLRRSDLPETFALLDSICVRLGTAPITAVVIDDQFNTSVTQINAERVLCIGVLLWEALTPVERLALLGHEVSHLVNGDPARAGLTRRAIEVTQRWLHTLSPVGGVGVAAEVVLAPMAFVVELVQAGLLRLMYLDSQRAEYLADALGAGVSGRDAAIAALEKTSLGGLLQQEMSGMGIRIATNPRTVLARLANAVSDPPAAPRAQALAKIQAELLTTDSTHPPTAYRIAFLRSLPEPAQVIDGALSSAHLETEWQGQLDKQATRIAQALEKQ